jgi:hypothetical protein
MKDGVSFEDVVFRVMRRRVMRGHQVRRRSGFIATRCRNACEPSLMNRYLLVYDQTTWGLYTGHGIFAFTLSSRCQQSFG